MVHTIPKSNIEALKIIVDKLKGKYINWALGGSMGLAIHGVDVEVKDIDILSDIDGAHRIAESLKEFNIEPFEYKVGEQFKSYYGLFKIHNVRVELIADLEQMEDNKWVKIDKLRMREIKRYEDMTIPLLDLRQEYDSYKNLGRTDKSDKILAFLQKEEKSHNNRTRAS